MSEKPSPPQAVPMDEFYKRQDRRSFLKKVGALGAALLGLGGVAAANNKDVQNSASQVGEKLGKKAEEILESPVKMREASFKDLQKSASGDSPSRVIPNSKVPPLK